MQPACTKSVPGYEMPVTHPTTGIFSTITFPLPALVRDDDDLSQPTQSHAIKMAIESRVQLIINTYGATSSSWG